LIRFNKFGCARSFETTPSDAAYDLILHGSRALDIPCMLAAAARCERDHI